MSDNPALFAAAQRGEPIVPVFIRSPEEENPWMPGSASRWWLHQSLLQLEKNLELSGSRLILRSGPALPVLQTLIRETGADAVFWNRRYEPAVIKRDRTIKESLTVAGVSVQSFNANLLFEPGDLRTQTGNPYQVFTPFWKACLNRPEPAVPAPRLSHIRPPSSWVKAEKLADFHLEPKINWAQGIRSRWKPGEAGALKQLRRFLDEALSDYPDKRNRPDCAGSSSLAPHLHFGEIGPRQVWHAVHKRAAQGTDPGLFSGAEVYLKEIGWREFAYHLLYHFPRTTQEPLHKEFDRFPWQKNPKALKLWQKGLTGYPVVDAGMRQLWETGWMHNRVRMIAASFLVKDLQIAWQEGAKWFWDTLVDADLANNTMGWQWVAGCGADAAPYYRVFNPTLQGERFDSEGAYVRQWIPELKSVSAEWIHEPWNAPASQRPSAYPPPCVDHSKSRDQALAAYRRLRNF